MKKSGLGKGLDALFSQNLSQPSVLGNSNPINNAQNNIIEENTKTQNIDINNEEVVIPKETIQKTKKIKEDSNFQIVNINDIEPNKNQARKEFDQTKLNELAESIKEFGLIQPIVVSKKDSYFSIIAGERRWRACKIAKISEIPIIIRDDDEIKNAQISLIENLQRENLNVVEKANGIKALMDKYNFTQNEVAQKIGKARSSITNTLRVLNLDNRVLEYAKDGQLTESQCKNLLEFSDPDEQYLACLSLLNHKQIKTEKIKGDDEKDEEIESQAKILYNQIENQFEMFFGSKVKLSPGKRKGKIIIEYSSNDDLERILGLIN